MSEWNITDKEGENIINNLLNKIFKKKVNKEEIPILMKKMSKENGIIIKKNGKHRNINNYIKTRFGNYNNMYSHFNLLNNKLPFIPVTKNINSNILSNIGDNPPPDDPNFWILLLFLAGASSMFFIFWKRKVI
jgi:hypothetical protein